MSKELNGVSVMTPEQFSLIRKSLGLSQMQLAPLLGYKPNKTCSIVSRMERGDKPIQPAHARLMLAYYSGYRPPDWPLRLSRRVDDYEEFVEGSPVFI